MRKACYSLSLAPFALLALIAFGRPDTHVTSIPVQDTSAPGSPFAVSGTVQIRETVPGHQVRTSITYNVGARNISGQTILALSAQLQVIPSYGAPQRFDTNIECFFAPDIIKPGQEESLSQRFPSESAEPFDANTQSQTPRAEFRVVFVQFLDGSVFGAEALGRQIMELRRITWHHLQHLDRTYNHEGEAAFVEQLMEPIDPPQVNTFFENLRMTQRQQGTQATMARIRGALQFAKDRKAGFRNKQD